MLVKSGDAVGNVSVGLVLHWLCEEDSTHWPLTGGLLHSA